MAGTQPPVTIRLHMCGTTNDGRLWHASRPKDNSGPVPAWGPWSPWEEVKAMGADDAGPFVNVACAVIWRDINSQNTEEFHVCALTVDGRLLHTSRVSPNDWQPFEDLKTRIQGNWGTFQVEKVSSGSFLDDVCVIVLTTQGQHRILRTAHDLDGNWGSFEDVTDTNRAGFPGSFTNSACANVSPEGLIKELHVCGVTQDGKLWHTMRTSANPLAWQLFEDVTAAGGGNPGSFSCINIAVNFVPPGGGGGDITCEQIRRNIANDRLQIHMMQQSSPNDPRIAARKQDIARLQNKGRQHRCPPQDWS